jgi:hypothetical protein
MAGTRGKRTRDEEPVKAAAPAAKASKAAKAPAKVKEVKAAPAAKASKAAASKAAAKEEKAKPAAKASKATKKGAAAKADPKVFTETLMDVCKVLMGVCEVGATTASNRKLQPPLSSPTAHATQQTTALRDLSPCTSPAQRPPARPTQTVMDEDEENFSIATAKDFSAHGAPLLRLLPQESRLPLMNIACMYMEELDTDPYMWGDADSDSDDEDDEEIDEGDEEQQAASPYPNPNPNP